MTEEKAQFGEDLEPGDRFFFDFNRYAVRPSETNSTLQVQQALKEGRIHWPGQAQIKHDEQWAVAKFERGSTMPSDGSPQLKGYHPDPIQSSALF